MSPTQFLYATPYMPHGGEATFENGKNLESIFILNIFLYKIFVFFIQKN